MVKTKLLDYLQNNKTSTINDQSALASYESKVAEIKTSLADMDIKISFLEKETKRLKRLSAASVVPRDDYESKVQELKQIRSQRSKYLATEISTNFEQVEDLSSKLESLEQEKMLVFRTSHRKNKAFPKNLSNFRGKPRTLSSSHQ